MILGIDPGFGRLGYSLIHKKGKEEVVEMGIIHTRSADEFPKRLHQVREDLNKVVSKYDIKECAIEKLFFLVNKKTAMDVAQAKGVVVELCYSKGFEIWEYSPSQIKKSVTGSGSAGKKEVIEMMRRFYNLEEKVMIEDDAFDALAVAFTHKYSISRKLR